MTDIWSESRYGPQYPHRFLRGIFMSSLDRRQFVGTAALVGFAAIPSAISAADKPAVAPAAKFQLGTVTYNVAANWDLTTVLDVCKKVGIAAVECRTTHKHGVEPGLNAEQRRAVKSRFADSGVVFWGSGSVCEFHSDSPAVVAKNIEDCKAFLGLVADLGGRGVKVRPNGLVKGLSLEKSLEQIGKALIECGKAAADLNLDICVEVHGKDTQLPANMKTIMEHCGHKSVGVTWNSNPTDVVDGSVAANFALLKPWIRSCHINEIYKAAYPYRELFRLLRESNYDRYTMIEVGRTPVDVASGEEMLRYYKALWNELVKG